MTDTPFQDTARLDARDKVRGESQLLAKDQDAIEGSA